MKTVRHLISIKVIKTSKSSSNKPVMDDKINTPTDINKFGGGKKVDKKTLKRMNKPRTNSILTIL
ncbi:MAG: hypothetical protein CM15mV20_1860 [uncultured marine virus]|nr:MAG: hypothetical protein CM15mV20_1860 [uncultured marine virus]